MIWAWIALGVLAWLGAGFVAAGFDFADWQREYRESAVRDRSFHRRSGLMLLPLGPIGLLMVPMMDLHRHGWLNPFGPGEDPKPVPPVPETTRTISFSDRTGGIVASPKPKIPELVELMNDLEGSPQAKVTERIEATLKRRRAMLAAQSANKIQVPLAWGQHQTMFATASNLTNLDILRGRNRGI